MTAVTTMNYTAIVTANAVYVRNTHTRTTAIRAVHSHAMIVNVLHANE